MALRKKTKKKAASAKKPRSKYSKVSSAEIFGDMNYTRPGEYIVLVDSIEEGENHQNKDYVQLNMRVVAVRDSGPEGYDYERRDKEGEPKALPWHKVGEEIVDKMMSDNVAFNSNLKKIAMVMGGLTDDDFEAEEYPGQIIEEMVGESQPLAGKVVHIRSTQVVKKKAKSKDEEDLANDDVYTRTSYIAVLDGDDILEEVDEDAIEKFNLNLDDGDDIEEEDEEAEEE